MSRARQTRQAKPQVRASRRRGRAAVVLALSLAFVVSSTATARAAPPPSPLPWTRLYVSNDPVPLAWLGGELLAGCDATDREGFRENGSTGPRVAVLGD